MHLYHFSEEPDIEVFVPRVKENRQDMPPVVWAIDEEHQFTFYFPRNCPRIVYTRTEELNDEDQRTFFGVTKSDIVVTVETHWYKQIAETTTYRYTLPGDSFEMFDETAGYYISRQAVTPLHVEPINNLLGRLLALNIEVRMTPDLSPLREAILNSSMKDFGIHRFANEKYIKVRVH